MNNEKETGRMTAGKEIDGLDNHNMDNSSKSHCVDNDISQESLSSAIEAIAAKIKEDGNNPELLVIAGSHSWGLNRPDSDLDIRGIYGWSFKIHVSLYQVRDNIESISDTIDYQIYEIAKALKMLCANNGNTVEMLNNPLVIYETEWGRRLRVLGERAFSKKLAEYYLGYATGQRKRAMKNRGGKSLIYTMREIYAGTMLMMQGKIIFDFNELRQIYEDIFGKSRALAWALENRDTPTPDSIMKIFDQEWQVACNRFKQQVLDSDLPESLPRSFISDCQDLLYNYRIAQVPAPRRKTNGIY